MKFTEHASAILLRRHVHRGYYKSKSLFELRINAEKQLPLHIKRLSNEERKRK